MATNYSLIVLACLAGMGIIAPVQGMQQEQKLSLFQACQQNKLELVQEMLQEPSQDIQDEFSKKKVCVTSDNIPLVQLLLTHHLNPKDLCLDATDKKPWDERVGILLFEPKFWANSEYLKPENLDNKTFQENCKKQIQEHYQRLLTEKELLACLKINKHTKGNIEQAHKLLQK